MAHQIFRGCTSPEPCNAKHDLMWGPRLERVSARLGESTSVLQCLHTQNTYCLLRLSTTSSPTSHSLMPLMPHKTMDDRARAAYEDQSVQLRAELKKWEGDWATANGGKKPGRGDIKQNPDIGACSCCPTIRL